MEMMKKNEEMGGCGSEDKNSNMPPDDDCCPICFDDFNFPCRTSCAHWFCSSCILELWRYQANSKQCKCPICGCFIHNLVPQSSLLTHSGPGEEDDDDEVGKILGDIQLYNRSNMGGLSGLLMKAAGLPALIRRGLWDNLNLTMLEYICNSMHKIGLLLGILYEVFEFQFFPNGGIGVAVWFDICIYGVVMFLLWQRCLMAMRRLP